LSEVLALDLPGGGNTTDFSFLTPKDDSERITRVDPLVDFLDGPLTLPEQAQRLLRRLSSAPEVVLAYCAGATLGVHLADFAGARLVLVDPYPINTEVIHFEFTKLCRTLVCDAPSYEGFAASDIVQWEAVLKDGRDRVAELYGGDEAAFEMVDGLLDRYRCWLRFLEACATTGPAFPRGKVIVLAGKPPSPLEAMLAEPANATVRHVDAAGDTLASARVRAMLSAAIGGDGA
jgi:hypothetical protein